MPRADDVRAKLTELAQKVRSLGVEAITIGQNLVLLPRDEQAGLLAALREGDAFDNLTADAIESALEQPKPFPLGLVGLGAKVSPTAPRATRTK